MTTTEPNTTATTPNASAGSASKSKSKVSSKGGTLLDLAVLLKDYSSVNWAEEMENETIVSTQTVAASGSIVEQKLNILQARSALPSGPRASRDEAGEAPNNYNSRPQYNSGGYGQRRDQDRSGGGGSYNNRGGGRDRSDYGQRGGYQPPQQQRYDNAPQPRSYPNVVPPQYPVAYAAPHVDQYQTQAYVQHAPMQQAYFQPPTMGPPAHIVSDHQAQQQPKYGTMPRGRYDERSVGQYTNSGGGRPPYQDDRFAAQDRNAGGRPALLPHPPMAPSNNDVRYAGGTGRQNNYAVEAVERMYDPSRDFIRSGTAPVAPQYAASGGEYASDMDEASSRYYQPRNDGRRSMPPETRGAPQQYQHGRGGGGGSMQRSYNGDFDDSRSVASSYYGGNRRGGGSGGPADERHRGGGSGRSDRNNDQYRGGGSQRQQRGDGYGRRGGGGGGPVATTGPSLPPANRDRRRSMTSSIDDAASVDETGAPKERPKLNLKPRTKPVLEEIAPPPPATKTAASIFGGAKPVDTQRRDEEIEQKQMKERQEAAERLKREEEERIAKEQQAAPLVESRQKKLSASDSPDTDHRDHRENRPPRIPRFIPPRHQRHGSRPELKPSSIVEDPRPSMITSSISLGGIVDEPKLAPQKPITILQRSRRSSECEKASTPYNAELKDIAEKFVAPSEESDRPPRQYDDEESRRDSSLEYRGGSRRRGSGGYGRGGGAAGRPPRFQEMGDEMRRPSTDRVFTRSNNSRGGSLSSVVNQQASRSLDDADYYRNGSGGGGPPVRRGGRGGRRGDYHVAPPHHVQQQSRQNNNNRRRPATDADRAAVTGGAEDLAPPRQEVVAENNAPVVDATKATTPVDAIETNAATAGGGGAKKKGGKRFSDRQKAATANKANKPPLGQNKETPNFLANKFTLLGQLNEND